MIGFIKKEAVLSIATLFAIITAFIVPPGKGYIDYMNFRVLGLLLALMTVVAGLRKTQVMDYVARKLAFSCKTIRTLGFLLTFLCFFASMFVTNDVALLSFVPLSISVLLLWKAEKYIIYIVVMETVAANMGSMLTPMGNPQNLYLADFYNMGNLEFFKATVPVWLLSGIIIAIFLLKIENKPLEIEKDNNEIVINRRLSLVYGFLGLISILAVFNVISYVVAVAVVVAVVIVVDRRVLLGVDWFLLLTFIMFFIFVGNLGEIQAVKDFFGSIAEGRELFVGAFLSQIISNVPAAVMLSSFTENGIPLMIGVDIGGLGTPVASLASLISYRIYKEYWGKNTGRFMAVFLAVNFVILVLLLIFGYFYY